MTGAITMRTALATVEEQHGSVEELAYLVLSEKREVLDDSIPLPARAAKVGLSAVVLARVLASPEFKLILRADMVNSHFGPEREEEHVQHMAGVATGKDRRVMNSKGQIGYVDQAPADVIAAGKYLNELRGTPVERQQPIGQGLVVNFYQLDGADRGRTGAGYESDLADRTIEAEPVGYRPRRAGDLPPPGVLSRASGSALLPAADESNVDASIGAFYGSGAQEALDSTPLAELPAPIAAHRVPGQESPWPGAGATWSTSAYYIARERRKARQAANGGLSNTRPEHDDSGFADPEEADQQQRITARRQQLGSMHQRLADKQTSRMQKGERDG